MNEIANKKEDIKREDILEYSYCEEDGSKITVLNEDYLKRYFNANKVVFKEN